VGGVAVGGDVENVLGGSAADEGDNLRTDVEEVSGGMGSDRITGSSAANRIVGNAGDDIITGGRGSDSVSGDAGNDRVLLRDRERDSATGGAGRDCHQSDRIDRVSGFERAC